MIKKCYGYRLLCQIDEIFHSLNEELTAVAVYTEQLSHPLDQGQKTKPFLFCTESVEQLEQISPTSLDTLG